MPNAGVVYRCPRCGREYSPIQAAQRGYFCCRVQLERIERSQGRESLISRLGRLLNTPIGQLLGSTPTETAVPPADSAEPPAHGEEATEPPSHPPPVETATPMGQERPQLELVEIIPPLRNQVDALQMEQLLASLDVGSPPLSLLQRLLGATETLEAAVGPFSLELAGDKDGIHFYIRAPAPVLAHLQQQLEWVYKQVEFEPVPPERDPARRARGGLQGIFTLTEPCYLPLRTCRDGDFQDADPLNVLLGAFGGCAEEEVVLSQLILKRAPYNWGKRWLGSTRRIETGFAGPTMTTETNIKILTFTILAIGFMAGMAWAAMNWVMGNRLPALILLLLFPLVAPILWFIRRSMPIFQRIDPDMVKRKVQLPAYDAVLRVTTAAPSPTRRERRLQQLASAYALFNMTSGNSLVMELASFDPTTFPPIHSTLEEALSARPFDFLDLATAIYQNITDRRMRLNVAEIASMWHLPVGEMPGVDLALEKELVPRRDLVAEGVPIGHAGKARPVLVHLSPEAMRSHMLIVGKTQKGKSNLMEHLAAAAMADPDTAVVVLEPHGDLTRSLIGLVPEERVRDVILIDFSNEERAVGLNILDLNQGRSKDKIVSNLVHMGTRVWGTYWGPRMESALRYATHTLLDVNEVLLRQHRRQFTLLDLNYLFNYPGFRQYLLDNYDHPQQILSWWYGFDRLPPYMREEVPNPVKTKMDRFAEAASVRRTIGQSDSTINFREILAQRRIVLINTAVGLIGEDAGGLLGSVLLDTLNLTIREQMALPPERRARVMVLIDEFQAIPGVDYGNLLAELAKMGATFVLSTQSLAQLDVLDPSLRYIILSNVDTLFVFQSSAQDAQTLKLELDQVVDETDIINLPDYHCYVKTKKRHERLPVMGIKVLPPLEPNPDIARQVLEAVHTYTVSAERAERSREAFVATWYERWQRAAARVRAGENASGRTRRSEPPLEQMGLPGIAGQGDEEELP